VSCASFEWRGCGGFGVFLGGSHTLHSLRYPTILSHPLRLLLLLLLLLLHCALFTHLTLPHELLQLTTPRLQHFKPNFSTHDLFAPPHIPKQLLLGLGTKKIKIL
jgi:hypothetical protein